MTTQRLNAVLTPLGDALASLLDRLDPVAPVTVSLADALGCIVAAAPDLKQPVPRQDMAVTDGWALRADDLVGASSYAPVALPAQPAWVDAGDRMPDGCDCVVDIAQVEKIGSIAQAMAEAIPGQGVRRAGGDLKSGASPLASGRSLRPLDVSILRIAGTGTVEVRRPRVAIVAVPPAAGEAATVRLIAEEILASGAEVAITLAKGRDAASITAALDQESCDLLLMVGGTGLGRADAAIAALASRGKVWAHGLALQPGRTAAVGSHAGIPVIALPGAPDQALAVWWALAWPVLDRLAGRQMRSSLSLPLARKIASSPGVADIVLLEKSNDAWLPLATGDLSLAHLAQADAWLAVPGASEGYAAGTRCTGFLLREV